jgi:sulfonate transport system substrate-binding protein
MKRTVLKAIVFVIFLAFAFFGCTEKTEKEASGPTGKTAERVLRIGFPSSNPYPTDTLAIAQEKGFVDKRLADIGATLEVINFTGSGPAINEAFASGDLDAAVYGDVPNIVAKSNGVNTTLIAIQHLVQNAGIIVPVDSNIKNIKDLKGKSIATLKGSYMHRTLTLMLEANGMTLDDIEFVNMGSTEAIPALLAKQIDSTLVSSTTLAQALGNGSSKLILDCTDNPEWKGSEGYIVLTSYLQQNPDIIKALVAGLFEALDYLHTYPDETKQIWSKSGYTLADFDLMYPDNKFPFNLSLDEYAIKTYESIEKFLLDNALIRNQFSIRDWADVSFIQSVKK